MKDIVILGAGGFAREVAFLIEEINRVAPTWNLLGFVGLDESEVGSRIGSYSVICTERTSLEMHVSAAIAIGDPNTIQKVVAKLKIHTNISLPNLVHPTAMWDQDRVLLGEGNIICAGNLFTTDIRIGSFNIINLGCTIGHDVEIGSYCVVNPGSHLSGSVKIGNSCLIGSGAVILQKVKIGDKARIGAGAVVVRNVATGITVTGVPAKPVASVKAADK